MLDRLCEDCSPLQFLRELTQNAIEAVQCTEDKKGEVVWDTDRNTFALTSRYKLCVMDNGVGMTGEEMMRYINALSLSVNVLSNTGNYGVGAKTRRSSSEQGRANLSVLEGRGRLYDPSLA